MYVRWYKATLLDSKKWTSMNGKVRELLSVKTASVKTPIDSHVDVIAHDDFAPFHQFRLEHESPIAHLHGTHDDPPDLNANQEDILDDHHEPHNLSLIWPIGSDV